MFAFHVSHHGPFSVSHDVDTDLKAIHIHDTDMYWYVHINYNMNNAKPYQTIEFHKYLLEHTHIHLFSCYLCLFLCYSNSNNNDTVWSPNPNLSTV